MPDESTNPRLIDQQHRVALPPEVRKALGVERGDYLTFEIKGNEVRLRRVAWKAV